MDNVVSNDYSDIELDMLEMLDEQYSIILNGFYLDNETMALRDSIEYQMHELGIY